jgi:hypothetical protein
MSKTTKRPARKTARPSRRATDRRQEVHAGGFITEVDLARLGDGQVAYIRAMTNAEARRMFPSIKGLPRGIDLYALHAADGTPIALTDSRQAAVGHAIEGELEIASVH